MATRAKRIAARARGTARSQTTGEQPRSTTPEDPGGTGKLYGERVGKAGLGLPGRSVKQQVREFRQQQKAAGVRGPALRQAIKGARGGFRAARRDELMAQIPEEMRPYVKNPAKWLRKNIKGIQPFRRLAAIQQTDEMLGLQEERDAARRELAQQYDPETGKAKIDFREEEEPIMSQMETYVGGHLGQGFTPEERAAYYGAMHDPVMAQERANYENEGERLAAAGIDPRSGLAAQRAAGIQATTGRALAEAGRATEEANLRRKQDFEKYAQDMSALEERKRSGMVESELGRLGKIEEGLAGQARIGEQGREFNYELAEGQRQAQQRREDIAKAAERMEPSTLEKVAGGISGFLGGLTGGGG